MIILNSHDRSLKKLFLFLLHFAMVSRLFAQEKGLTNTFKRAYAKPSGVDMGSVQWTKGFRAD